MSARSKVAVTDLTPETVAVAVERFLTLEAIASANDREGQDLFVPEWHGSVKIRALSYDDMTIAREKSFDPRKKETNEDLLNAWCLALGLLEPKIDYLIAKDWITERAFGPVNTILSEILALSGVGRRAQEAAKSAPEG
jgi:hypothetical protein